jgi:hypothetical protein
VNTACFIDLIFTLHLYFDLFLRPEIQPKEPRWVLPWALPLVECKAWGHDAVSVWPDVTNQNDHKVFRDTTNHPKS